ncbi:MAG: SPOR domain-containing protein [Rhodoferax sp.]|nr:SPOR domain-containing protein [Rhodoferax sp.]
MPTTTDSLPPPVSPQEDVTTTLYRAAIGPVGNAYYLPLFTRFEAADRASITWNTAASLLTLNWLMFRQLWGAALAYAGIVAGVFVLILGIGRLVLHFSNTLQMALLLGFGVLAFVLPGLFGNVLLHTQCRKRMERALAANAKIADACAELTAQASTHRRAMIQAGANAVLLILAVFLYVQFALFSNVDAMPQGALESGSVTQETPALGITASKHPLPATATTAAVTAVTAAATATSAPASAPASVAPPPPAPPASSAASSATVVATAPALPATAPVSVASAVAQVASQIAAPVSAPPVAPASTAPVALMPVPVAAVPKPVASAAAVVMAKKPGNVASSASAAPVAPKPKASEAASKPAASNEKRAVLTPKPAPKPAPKPPVKPAATTASAASAATAATREPVKSAAARDKGYFVNVGLFSVSENARSVAERLRAANLEVQLKEFKSETKGTMTRVRVGPFISQEGVQDAVETIQGLRLEAVIVRP